MVVTISKYTLLYFHHDDTSKTFCKSLLNLELIETIQIQIIQFENIGCYHIKLSNISMENEI